MRLRIGFLAFVCLLLVSYPVFSQDESVEAQLDRLATLDFDPFLIESYELFLLRFPESIIELGLADDFPMADATLNNLSDGYQLETEMIIREILTLLRTYDRSELTVEQQLSYDVYEWYLDDLVRAQAFRLYDFPVSYFLTAGQNQTHNFFTELHPLETPQDARDYVTRLWLVDAKFGQLVDAVNLREDAGIIPPTFVIDVTMGELNRLSRGAVQQHDYYRPLEDAIDTIDGMSDDEKSQLLAEAQDAVSESVMVGYAALADTMGDLRSRASQAVGVWQYPDGEAFYEYALRHHTTTDLSADGIHDLGLQELERIHAEMRVLFTELGYEASSSISDLYRQLAQESGFVAGNTAIETFETLLDDAQERLANSDAFSRLPISEVVIIADSFGGYYIPPSLDGARPGAFYAGTNTQPTYNMDSLLYHEAVPGHHLQIAWSQDLDLPFFRRITYFTAYVEGWALYAEHLASDLGWYADNPEGDLGRLQYEAFRAARLVVDTGIHAKQWSFDDATIFFAQNTGFTVDSSRGQIARYVVWPGQSTAYMVGMLELLALREQMQNAQGDGFSLAAFHDIVLNSGSVPLAILADIVAHEIDN